jgi:hypothetical protein
MKRTILAIAALVPFAAAAQEAAPQLPENPRAARYHEVERGLFVGCEIGFLGFNKTLNQNAAKFPSAGSNGGFASGFLTGVDVGYDITSRVALSVFAMGGDATANSSYGAFDVVATGLDLRYAVPVAKDRNGVERLFLYLHGRAGYLWSHPAYLFATTDVLYGAGFGAEYFTHLRHFSVGMTLDADYLRSVKALGFVIAPTLRYTF